MAATSFFGGEFFGGEFFNTSSDVVKTGTGGIDQRGVFKPTGLLHRPRKPIKEGRKDVADRVEESRQIEAEVRQEFREEKTPVVQMSLAEVEREIGLILRKKIRTEKDEILLLLFMVGAANA